MREIDLLLSKGRWSKTDRQRKQQVCRQEDGGSTVIELKQGCSRHRAVSVEVSHVRRLGKRFFLLNHSWSLGHVRIAEMQLHDQPS